jgi:hypothetical protein
MSTTTSCDAQRVNHIKAARDKELASNRLRESAPIIRTHMPDVSADCVTGLGRTGDTHEPC